MEVGSDKPGLIGIEGRKGRGHKNLVGWLSRALSTPVAERKTKSRRPSPPLFPITSSWNKRVPDT